MNETFFTWMAHVGANLNGIAGIVMCAVPPALSSLWYYNKKVYREDVYITKMITLGSHQMNEPLLLG